MKWLLAGVFLLSPALSAQAPSDEPKPVATMKQLMLEVIHPASNSLLLLVAHAFNRQNLPTDSLHRERVTGIERMAVDEDAARAAAGFVAAAVRSGQSELDGNHFP